MTNADFYLLGVKAVAMLRGLAPKDTGNLANNAIRFQMTDNKFEIFIDQAIAPYMPYTNEVWEQKMIKMGNFKKGETVERMRTWENPNEGWFNAAALKIVDFITKEIGGIKE